MFSKNQGFRVYKGCRRASKIEIPAEKHTEAD
jgi:hypothetical protein